MIFDRSIGGKTFKIKWLFESNLRYLSLRSATSRPVSVPFEHNGHP